MAESFRIKNILESLFFVAREPMNLEDLEAATGFPREEMTPVLEELLAEYQGRGIRLMGVAGGYLMGTNPENAAFVQKILQPRVETTLSPQALETLAIIAYKRPVTRAEIEKLRGVDSGGVLDTLLAKKLIREAGRGEAVGRPYLYETTTEFLRHFGLKEITDLPPQLLLRAGL
ncbi:SMC-Scp complex subunit ScpB [Candidatus Saganbacteria bacterium]|uniref:SMC-Scp complex subunit ScpB n=1 Tax=Candidatus Saganbacteria bacterium TaxID=2575572 RepID=A0A9D6UMP6_UNCSA|nr:SMC-Scp complex subunit ScpB [Candidatus Saganbacteria bacterium]